MRYQNISFYHFRNICDGTIALHSKYVLLLGDNAQGKTNVLEAIYLLSYGTSFRTNRFDEIKTFQHQEFSLNATTVDENDITHDIHLQYAHNQKEIRLNQNKIEDRKDLLHYNPTVIFSYDDYEIVTEGHERRRIFFDQIQCFLSIRYVDLIRNYRRVLNQRNKALKEHNHTILDAYNYQLAACGIQIMDQRRRCIEMCSQYADTIFNNMSPTAHALRFTYSPSWAIDSDTSAAIDYIERKTEDDIRYGYTSSGPHRDRILFYINDKNATTYASTGQIRSIALIIKVVQAIIVFDTLKKKPILLFDDVLLELDGKREEGILAQLPQVSQLFFTFLPDREPQSLHLHDVQRISVNHGTLST